MTITFSWKETDLVPLFEGCRNDPIFHLSLEYITNECAILESGCGVGRWVKCYHDLGYKICGIDHSRENIKMIKTIWPDLEVITGDVISHPFKDESFDLVLSYGVIEHFQQGPQKALTDIHRILKPGGIGIITVPCMNTIRKYKHPFTRDYLIKKSANGEFYEYIFSPKFFLKTIKSTDFDVLEEKPHGLIDGFYHDLNPFHFFIKFNGATFEPEDHWINKLCSKIPYFHCHMQMVVVRKPK